MQVTRGHPGHSVGTAGLVRTGGLRAASDSLSSVLLPRLRKRGRDGGLPQLTAGCLVTLQSLVTRAPLETRVRRSDVLQPTLIRSRHIDGERGAKSPQDIQGHQFGLQQGEEEGRGPRVPHWCSEASCFSVSKAFASAEDETMRQNHLLNIRSLLLPPPSAVVLLVVEIVLVVCPAPTDAAQAMAGLGTDILTSTSGVLTRTIIFSLPLPHSHSPPGHSFPTRSLSTKSLPNSHSTPRPLHPHQVTPHQITPHQVTPHQITPHQVTPFPPLTPTHSLFHIHSQVTTILKATSLISPFFPPV
ncbi:hypothetical protein O3P69_011450 [Scylla paramamosain]|uniref:Uncharacterized protein n=1 Tax=Scylla paramamosain TaxID=85552 RepID=A0AAW0T6Q9_SCYPA